MIVMGARIPMLPVIVEHNHQNHPIKIINPEGSVRHDLIENVADGEIKGILLEAGKLTHDNTDKQA